MFQPSNSILQIYGKLLVVVYFNVFADKYRVKVLNCHRFTLLF